MHFKWIVSLFVSFSLYGCASAPVPEDQKAAFQGSGEVTTVVMTDDHYQEVSVKAPNGLVVVMLKEPIEVFPGQEVKVDRKSGGFGTITVK